MSKEVMAAASGAWETLKPLVLKGLGIFAVAYLGLAGFNFLKAKLNV